MTLNNEQRISISEPINPGLRCPNCRRLSEHRFYRHLSHCHYCRSIYTVTQLFMNACEEFQLIYPDVPLTRRTICQWCDGAIKPEKVSQMLKKHFQSIGRTKGTYYLDLNSPLCISNNSSLNGVK